MSVQLRRANMRSIRAAPRVVLAFFRLRGGSRTRRPQRSSLHEPARRAHRMGRPRARVAGRGRRREGLAAARPARLACAGESARPAGAGRVAPGSTHLRRQVMRRSAAATRRGRTTSRQRFQDVLGLRRRARVVPGEVAISSGRSQLRELTTAPMKGGHDPPENGFPGKKALSQRFPVAVKQRLATRDASQGTPKTACQDSRQAQIEPDDTRVSSRPAGLGLGVVASLTDGPRILAGRARPAPLPARRRRPVPGSARRGSDWLRAGRRSTGAARPDPGQRPAGRLDARGNPPAR